MEMGNDCEAFASRLCSKYEHRLAEFASNTKLNERRTALTSPPTTKGMQNHVRFLASCHVCKAVMMKNTMQAIAPPAVEGV